MPQVTYSTKPAVAAPKAKALPTIQSVIAQGAKDYKPLAPATPLGPSTAKPLDYAGSASSGAAWTPFTPPKVNPAGGAKAQYAAEQATGAYESDPVLAQTKQAMMGQVATRVGDTNRTIKDALRTYGDAGLARQATFFTADPNVTTTGDEETALAAAANPVSTLAQLARQHELRRAGLDQNLTNSNLYYSSTRGNELGNEGQQYLGEQGQASADVGSLLSEAVRGLLGSRDQARDSIAKANSDAYNRALDIALKYGTDPTANGAGTTYNDAGLTPQPITHDLVKPGVLGPGWGELPVPAGVTPQNPIQQTMLPGDAGTFGPSPGQTGRTIPTFQNMAGGQFVNDTIGAPPASVLASIFGPKKPAAPSIAQAIAAGKKSLRF